MSTQSTDHRERLMAALSAAEHLVSRAPVAPDTVGITHHTDWPAGAIGVDMHFRRNPDGLRAFAGAVGVGLGTVLGEFGGAEYAEVTAHGVLGDVPFRSWVQVAVSVVVAWAPAVVETPAEAEQSAVAA